jgi:hypothetical protein
VQQLHDQLKLEALGDDDSVIRQYLGGCSAAVCTCGVTHAAQPAGVDRIPACTLHEFTHSPLESFKLFSRLHQLQRQLQACNSSSPISGTLYNLHQVCVLSAVRSFINLKDICELYGFP